jgi:hypothetical protein
MGAAISQASNTANLTNNVSMNDSATCAATQVVDVANAPVSITNTTVKGDTTVNGTKAGQDAQCALQVAMGAQAKNQADQATQQKTSAGPALAWAQSGSNNVLNLQNDIEMSVSATCGAQQSVTVKNQAIVLNGNVFDGNLSLNGTDASQNFSCTQDLDQQAAAGNSSDQTNKQTTTAHVSIAGALLILAVLFIIFGLPLYLSMKLAGAPVSVGKSIGAGPAKAAKELAQAQGLLLAACTDATSMFSDAAFKASQPAIHTAFGSALCSAPPARLPPLPLHAS